MRVVIARLAVDQQSDVRDYPQVLAIALYHAEEFGECADILTSLSGDGETALPGLRRAIAIHEPGDVVEADLLGRHMHGVGSGCLLQSLPLLLAGH